MLESEVNSCIKTIGWISMDISSVLKNPPKDYTNFVNAFNEPVSSMDELTNQFFISELGIDGWCAAVASEELVSPKVFNMKNKYIVTIDPLDGSSNINSDNPVGSIFGIYEVPDLDSDSTEEFFFQNGHQLVMAGYVLYGYKTTIIAAANGEVKEYSYLTKDTFVSNKIITCPQEGKIVAVNSGNYPKWNKLTCDWFDTVVEYGKSSFRYSGCMVADFHRVLLEGGIFAYPSDRKNINGKLRLLYECAPLAFIIHTAGGTSTNGDSKTKSILDITPTSLHQTTPVFLGSKQNIEDYFRG